MERPKWVKNVLKVGALAASLLAPVADGSNSAWADPQVIVRGNPDRREIALTFDCGPWVNESYISSILDALGEYGHKVTFFVTGEFLEKYKQTRPDIISRIVENHELANHTHSHLDHTKYPEQIQREQLRWAEEIVNGYGVSTKPFWRPPFGAWNRRVVEIAEEEGYPLTIMWTTDSGDWIPNKSAEAVKATVLSQAVNGAVFVHHCNSWQTAEVLPSILWHLKEWGIGVVPVSRGISE